jgi:micrococcal nuclease
MKYLVLLLFVLFTALPASAQCPTGYDVRIEHVVDGDTLDVFVNLGFSTYQLVRLRLAGVDTPEVYGVKKWADKAKTSYTAEYAKGAAASDFTKKWVDEHCKPCIVTTEGTGKYGRWIAVLSPKAGGESLNDALLRTGNAQPSQ